MEDQNRPNTGGAGGGNSTRGRIGGGNKKASTKVDLPQALNSESATKTDSVSLSKQRWVCENPDAGGSLPRPRSRLIEHLLNPLFVPRLIVGHHTG